MNRRQRRSQEKLNRYDSLRETIEQKKLAAEFMAKCEEEAKEWAQNTYTGMFYTVFLLVLRRKYGWGKKRIYRVLDEIAAIVNDLENEVIDISDLVREAKEAGMSITMNAKRQIVKVGIFEECDETYMVSSNTR